MGCALIVWPGMPQSGGFAMAKPQVENGFLKIANELIEQFAMLNLTKYEWRVLMAILRSTYGWNQKAGAVTTADIVKITKIKRPHVSRARTSLMLRKILIIDGSDIGLNKDYDNWLPPEPRKSVPIRVQKRTNPGTPNSRKSVPIRVRPCTNPGTESVPIRVHHTNIEIQKDIIKDSGGKEEGLLRGLNFQAWEDYEQYRREAKLKKLKPMSVKMQHKWLVSQGDEQAQQQIVDTTIRQGYHGLVGMRGGNKGKGANGTPREHADKMLDALNKLN